MVTLGYTLVLMILLPASGPRKVHFQLAFQLTLVQGDQRHCSYLRPRMALVVTEMFLSY